MRKIKALKKGMVLILTSVMLFIATSIVSILATFVIVSRNQKIEFEYVSRTKIALKSAAYDVYEVFLGSVASLSKFEISEGTRTSININSSSSNLNSNIDVKLFGNTVKGVVDYYFEYEIYTEDLKVDDAEYLREASIYVKIDYLKDTTASTDYQNPLNYAIKEMRFS